MACFAILPVRPVAKGKSRLAGALGDEDRISLNYKLFRHVLSVALEVFTPQRCLIVSHSPELIAEARAAGAHAEAEAGEDLNAALTQGARAVRDLGGSAVLALSSDLPFVQPEDLRAMLEQGREADIVIATDQHRTGTNALLMRPPLAIPFRYGLDSLNAHLAAARASGLTARVIDRPGLAQDIDTPDDLARLGPA